MKHQRLFALATGILLTAGTVSAQEKTQTWSLEDCLQYAYEQNIELKQSRLSLESSQIDTKNAKAKFFPNLSAGVSYQYTNTPFQETTGNNLDNYIITGNSGSDKNQLSGSYNLRSSLTLFNGGKLLNQVKSSKIAEEMQNASLEETFDNIESAIVTGYLQILYAQESVRINENTVEVSKAQCERGEKLKNAGSLSESDYAQLVSQYSNDKYQLVSAEANRDQLRLNLKQLLELDIDVEMTLALPLIDESKVLVPLPDKSTVYATALGFIPSIQSGKLELEVAELNIANAKAGYYPNLSLNAGIGSGHNTGSEGSLGYQLKQGFNESIGLTLSIPIYSKRANKSAVERAKIQQKISQLDLKNQEKDLLNEIESAWLDASSAQSQYLAAREQLNASQTSYELTEEQFYLGMKNTVEMLTAKNNWLSAQQEELQARYMALLNLKLLDYYENKPLTLD